MDIECPLCKHDETERLALTYSGGVTQSWTKSILLSGNLFNPEYWFQKLIGYLIVGLVLAEIASAPVVSDFIKWAIPVFFIGRILGSVYFGYSVTRSETLLASESEPPARSKHFLWLLFGVISGVCWVFFMLNVFGDGRAFEGEGTSIVVLNVSTLFTGMLFVLAGIAYPFWYNRKIWPIKEAVWQRTFMCKRCGGQFVVPEYDPIGINEVRSDKIGKGGGLPKAFTKKNLEAAESKAFTLDAEKVRKKTDPA